MAVIVTAIGADPAFAKPARCEIKTGDGSYSGPCNFMAEVGGSFSISPSGKADFFGGGDDEPGITIISVSVMKPDAEVRGLTTDGINSRWGPAQRSIKDGACWDGDDFSICVY